MNIHIDDKRFNELCNPWHEALIIKLRGKKVDYRVMKQRLSSMWKLDGDFELMDIDHGFFMVKFDRENDRDKVIGGGPWLLFDNCLAVSTWSPDFVSSTAKIEKTLVWVRFLGMIL